MSKKVIFHLWGTINSKKGSSDCLPYLICIPVKKKNSYMKVKAAFIAWISQFINHRTEFKVKEDALSQKNHPPHWREKKTTELILGRRLIRALLLGFGIDFVKWTPSALRALNPQWHPTRNDEEPDQTCQRRPQGRSQRLHILGKLKCDLVLFFSSLSDWVWCGDVNSKVKLLSPFYSSYFFLTWQESKCWCQSDRIGAIYLRIQGT